MISCIIVDDEPVARNIIRNYCSHLPVLNIVAECGNALDAKDILLTEKIDLLFLDIHLPVLNGMDFLNTLKHQPQVIFTTAYEEYAVNAFNLAACDYLLKPFSLDRFIIAIDKVKEKLSTGVKTSTQQTASADHFFIRSESKIFKLYYDDCLYAEAQGNYTRVVTNNTSHLTKMPFSTFIEMLPADIFIRVHRSFIINKEKISHIDGNRVFIMHKEVPLAVNYKEAFFKIIGL